MVFPNGKAILDRRRCALQRRLKKLREDKVIEAEVAIVNPEALGIGILCIVDISLEDGNSKALEKFKTSMRKCPEVSQCYFVAKAGVH